MDEDPGRHTKCAVFAALDSMGEVAVTVTGLDGRFYCSQRSRDDGTWSGWQSFDGGTGSSPTTLAGASDSKQYAYVFAGNDKHVYADGDTYKIAF
ncbi:hypothetical protein [Streptomyces sp. NPDC021224]|uniref:hypothetical protein n=1 Tax=unclassified Streptomyces TaxID=2593676 RepID=UPI00379EE9B9